MPHAADHPFRRGPKKAPTLEQLQEELGPIERKVRTIVADEMGVDFERATPETAFVRDLAADELDVVEIAINIEQAFDLEEIDDAHIEGFVFVRDVIEYVRRRR
jgi:acyl carrier protein